MRHRAVSRKVWFATPRRQPEILVCDVCRWPLTQPDLNQILNVPNQNPNDPSQIPNAPKQIPNDSNQIPTTADQIPNGSNQIPNDPAQIPTGSRTIPTRSQMIPARSQTIPSRTQMIPTRSKMVSTRHKMMPVYNFTRIPSHLITCTRWACVIHIFANCVQDTFKLNVTYFIFLSLFWFDLARCDQAKLPALPLACPN